MTITKTRIEIGLEKPFRALHMSDNHIALADNRDDERKIKLAESRTAAFNHGKPGNVAMEEYALQLDYARSHRLPVLYTGDLCDFVSYKNLDYARDTLEDIDYFMAVGNHEFSLYVGEAFEDLPYKMKSFDLVQSYFRNDLHFASRVMGGVNFVALDNGYYRFDADQLARMKREIEKGLPIVLMMHNPLHTQQLYDEMMTNRKQPCAYLTGTPDALMTGYDEYRFRQQRSDADTMAFIDYIYTQPLIKAVLAGHLHFNYETRLPSGIMQYVTGGGYCGDTREIEFV